MKILHKINKWAVIVLLLAIPVIVNAQILDKLKKVGGSEGAGFVDSATPKDAFTDAIGTIIGAFLGLLGVIFIILMLYAGYNWMIAGGREEKVTAAKETIKRAIIGLAITIGSYAIWDFIFYKVINN